MMKTDGFNAWRVLAFWFQARSTNDSMSLLTMIMNPDRAEDLSDMMYKVDGWDALIRDNRMKFEKNDISDKMRQADLFAVAPKAAVENRLAGRRDLDNYAKVRWMIDDMIRDKREARGAIKLSGGGNQPPPDVDQLKLREMTLDFAEEASEGESDTSSVRKLAESLGAIVKTLNCASKGKSKGKGKKKKAVDPGLLHGRTVAGNIAETASGGKPPDVARVWRTRESRWKTQGQTQRQRQEWRKGQGQRQRPHMRRLRGIGHTARTRPKVKTPMKIKGGPKRTTRHSNWVPWQRFRFVSSPPGLRDAFSEVGWTVVTRKSRNRQQCTRDVGALTSVARFLDLCGTLTTT